jgi:nucleotide-binding universal stress UspA family protein
VSLPLRSGIPVEVAHPWLAGRIVVGVDGSQHASNALRMAARLAQYTGARIEVVSAWRLPSITAPTMGPVRWSASDRARIALQESIVSAFESAIPESLTAFVQEGTAAAVLIELSLGADLLVVGRHARGVAARAMVGSVSATCAEKAHCPVLVVPE